MTSQVEPSSDDATRHRGPKSEPVLGAGTVRRIFLQGLLVGGLGLIAYILALGPLELDLAEARTATFIALTAAQLLAVFNARTDRGSGSGVPPPICTCGARSPSPPRSRR